MDTLIIPIFYNSESSVVQHQTGSSKEFFDQHEIGFDMDRLRKWRITLTNVGGLKGYQILQNM